MLKKEFIERTGFEPSDSDYKLIEQQYYAFDGDKDAFCKKWMDENGVQKLYDNAVSKITQLEFRLGDARGEIVKLEKRINKLEKWTPANTTGTRFAQDDYEALISSCNRLNEEITKEEIREYIHKITGFDKDKIEFVDEVNTYEVNCENMLRISGTYERVPVYYALDWNYARFDCIDYKWELINGYLVPYND